MSKHRTTEEKLEYKSKEKKHLIFLHDLHKMLKQNKVFTFFNASEEDHFWELFFGFVQKMCLLLQLFTF